MYHEIVLLGVLLSLIYTELTGFTAGLIIPCYLVLSLHAPVRIFWTLAVAMGAAGLCRLLSRWLILYGRRRFAMLLVLSFLLGGLVEYGGPWLGGASVIGMLIPGILAREIDRQGAGAALLSIFVTTGLLALIMLLRGYPVFGH